MSALAKRVAEAMVASDRQIASRWLERLEALVDEERSSILPGPQLLDHVPELIHALAESVAEPEGTFEMRTSTIAMASGLGRLRQRQGASLHQLLREFELLGEVLQEWLVVQAERLGEGTGAEWLRASARVHQALAAWMRLSADAFAHRYADRLQRERNEVEDLHRTVDHELRTPMGTIANVVGLLELDEQNGDTAGIVRRSLAQMTETLEMLRRDVWRPAEQTNVAVQECDLRSLVEDVLTRLQDSSASRGVELRMSGSFERVVLDIGALDLALVNLVSNAIKYAGREAPFRQVEVRGGSDDEEVIVEVRDNGIGVPAELQERIFERGFRAHREADPELGVDGDGLGLYLVRGCMESLDGRVELESEVGVGSCFRLRLPRKERA